MIEPRRAPVRPRGFAPGSSQALPLEDVVFDVIRTQRLGAIELGGPAGCGKTTALQHLAATAWHRGGFHVRVHEAAIQDWQGRRRCAQITAGSTTKLTALPSNDEPPAFANITFLDRPSPKEVEELAASGWVVYASQRPDIEFPVTARLSLAPWGEDERVEYLLHVHKTRCSSVMDRLRTMASCEFLKGNPELWSIVLDEMAAHDSVASPRDALNQFLQRLLVTPDLSAAAGRLSLRALFGSATLRQLDEFESQEGGIALGYYLRHRPVQLILAVRAIVADLQAGAACDYFQEHFPFDLVQETAAAARNSGALDTLKKWFTERPERHAMAASVLHAADSDWRPEPGARPVLRGAYLAEAVWPGVNLVGADLYDADLRHVDLQHANLNEVRVTAAKMSLARLYDSSLERLAATDADLIGADLSWANAKRAIFHRAKLAGANLSAADLCDGIFFEADLTAANLQRANLVGAKFDSATLIDADFTGANLERADLTGLDLSVACFAQARMHKAKLAGCNLEGLLLPNADFSGADLNNSLLTGTVMPKAKFDGASLQGAGLADVEWESASLRYADLRGASFHLGSTRSGRVDSPIACEGSRTGFYSDDFDEQQFRAPEEIRKANLRGADLRGAILDGVDFYLVDLRDARFDRRYEEHLRRSGAILVTK